MKYILMMNTMKLGGAAFPGWSREDMQAHIAFMHRINKELTESGELVGAEGLASPGEAKLVRASAKGGPPITDGVFPETKEFLAGYWLVDVDSTARAYEIAAKISVAPGPGGKPMYLGLEVRQVMRAPTTDT